MAIATSDSISLNTIKTLNDTANDAKTTAEELEQHFWFQDTGADAGAHITEVTQEEWSDPTDPNYHSGGNTLITSTGMDVRDGMTTFASFSATGAQIGKSSDTHSVIDANGMRIYASDGTTLIATLGYGVGNNANGGASTTPYFTLGTRVESVSDLNVQQYDNTIAYDIGEIVEYSGAYYIRTTNPEAGIVPTNSAYWTPLPTRYIGNYSITQGEHTIASAYSSTALGDRCIALGTGSHAEGGTASYNDRGGLLFPFGMPIAVENYSHAEGHSTVTRGLSSHAEGTQTIAYGNWSHSEGSGTNANGDTSHAEGETTTAQGEASHAEGGGTTAQGDYSHAEGRYSVAYADYSHAQNLDTIARSTAQTAIGKYNIADAEDKYALIIGNGTSNTRRNALTVDWSGNVETSGDVLAGGNSLSSAMQGVNFTATAGTTKTLTVPNNSAGYIITSGAHTNNQNIYIYNVSSNGTVTLKAMGTASNITTATSTRTITITGATYATRYTVVAFYGDLPTVS